MAATIAPPLAAIRGFEELRHSAQAFGPKRLGVVVADDDVALMAAAAAAELRLAFPVLIGDEAKIRLKIRELNLMSKLQGAIFLGAANATEAAATAARMTSDGVLDILLKGHLRTDELLRAILNKEAGLRTGRLLSDVMLYEDTLSGSSRLVGVTDGGLNVAPNLEQKKQILLNALDVMCALRIEWPKVAIMSASEAVTDAMPSTIDALTL